MWGLLYITSFVNFKSKIYHVYCLDPLSRKRAESVGPNSPYASFAYNLGKAHKKFVKGALVFDLPPPPLKALLAGLFILAINFPP